MGVTIGIGARGLVLQGSDDAENSPASSIPVYAEAVWTVEPGYWLGLSMAAIAGLGILVDDVIQFLAVSGVADASFPVKHPHSHHTRLIGYGAHHVVEAVAIVAQHVVRRAAFDPRWMVSRDTDCICFHSDAFSEELSREGYKSDRALVAG